MEELDRISQKDKLIFKEHYYKVQYALSNTSKKAVQEKTKNTFNKNRSNTSSI